MLSQVKRIASLLPERISPNRKRFIPNITGTPTGLNKSRYICEIPPINNPIR